MKLCLKGRPDYQTIFLHCVKLHRVNSAFEWEQRERHSPI